MKDPIYNISGDYDEILEIIKKEFLADTESEKKFEKKFGCTRAKLLVDSLTFEPRKGKNLEPFEPTTLWQLDSVSEPYQGSIGNSRFTISFKDSALSILDDNIVTIILAACGLEEIAGAAFVLNCIKTLIKNAHYITSDECCVYYQILHYFKNNNISYIKDAQCMPNRQKEGDNYVCANLDKNWKCPFRCGKSNEHCCLTIDNVGDILKGMCDENILVNKNDRYTLIL